MRIHLEEAEKIIEEGGIVAVPTETVYGLAASLKHPKSIEKIFSLKKRHYRKPLSLSVSSLDMLKKFRPHFPPLSDALIERFWPGPLTLVLKTVSESIPEVVNAGLETVGFRMPSSKTALNLIERCGPMVLTSANLSGKPSSIRPEQIEADFGKDFPVIDGGVCDLAVESTLLTFDGQWKILRLGAIKPESFKNVLGYIPEVLVLES